MSESQSISIVVNGKPMTAPRGMTLLELVRSLDLDKSRVAAEVNKEVVRRSDHASRVLAAGDRIEIVTFVGGG